MPKKTKKKTVAHLGIKTMSNERVFEEIIKQFPDIIHSVDKDGHIVATNYEAEKLLGYSHDELIGKDIREIYAQDVLSEMIIGFEKLKIEGSREAVESKLVSKDGENIDVEVRSLSIYNKAGEFVRTFSIIRDIREIIGLRAQLIHQGKLAAIGELSSGIMHDIRNPLTVITAYTDRLSKAIDKKDFAIVKDCQEKMKKAAKRIERLSDHLHQFVRVKVEDPEKLSLKHIIDNCLLMVESRIKAHGVTLIDEIDEENDIEFIGRPGQLEQVFINLLSNACDAMNGSKKRELTITVQKMSTKFQVMIKDTGKGIEKKNLERIFEAFFTTKPKGKGSGLGLSTTSSIVSEQGGNIIADSEVDVGTIFKVTLPLDVIKYMKS